MDILRKELNEIYARQRLGNELLDEQIVISAVEESNALANITGMCAVVTDAAADRSFYLDGQLGSFLGLSSTERSHVEIPSSDEDFLYHRMVPADLVDLRMLEYEFFKHIDSLCPEDKLKFKAVADVRMHCNDDKVATISKSTQVVRLSPQGKIWLILCTYDLLENTGTSTNPRIIDLETGDVKRYSFNNERKHLLTDREKEILNLIRAGKLSKEIAPALGISVNTVNRHRQNILEKLSVDNSIEAVNAAIAMGLICP